MRFNHNIIQNHSIDKNHEASDIDLSVDGCLIPSFDEDLLIQLCEDATRVFQNEENTIIIEGDVIIIGDIHGSFHDLLRIIRLIETSQYKVVFLGDYVDRGAFSLECITLLFSLKLLKPDIYFLLRGNHEFNEMCSHYGFKKEILNYHNPKKPDYISYEHINPTIEDENYLSFEDENNSAHSNEDICDSYFANHININCYKYTEKLYDSFMKAFSYLPICSIVNNTSLCIHGGLSQLFEKVEDVNTLIQRPVKEFEENHLLSDIVWGDPSQEQAQNFSDNPRGRGQLFNGPVVVNFLKRNNLKRLIRGHECVLNGVERLFNDKCITVFSASSYCCDMGNSSGILKLLSKSDDFEVIVFQPIHRLKKFDANYYKVQAFNSDSNLSLHKMHSISEYKSGFLSNFARISSASSEQTIAHHHFLASSIETLNLAQNSTNEVAKNSLFGSIGQKIHLKRRSSLRSGPRKKIICSNNAQQVIQGPNILTPKVTHHSSDFEIKNYSLFE